MNKKLIFALTCVALMGCSTAKKATAVKTVAVQAQETIAQGKELYENRCGKCHKLFAATDYPKERWPSILNKMQQPAGITDEQKAQIMAYIAASAK